MGERLFDTVFVAGRRRARSAFSLPVSVAIHAVAIGAVLAVSLSATTPLAPPVPPPIPRIAIARPDPAPPPAQPPPVPRRAVPRGGPPPHASVQVPVSPPSSDEQRRVDEESDPTDPGPPSVPVPGWGPGPGGGSGNDPTGSSTDGSPVGTGTGPVRAGYEVREPRKIRHVEPVYPELAKIAGISAVVEIECIINTEGRVTDLRVLRGNPLFNDNAVRAVQQWLYTPTSLNGRLVPVILTVRITFKVR